LAKLRSVLVGPDFLIGFIEETDMADAAPTVTFPDDYPNSVRHFLLIGFLGMFIGSIVFFYMGISRKVNTVSHVLTFFIAAVASCSYYAMWAGLGVEYKTTDTTPRVIFWARYLDWIVTLPVSLNSLNAYILHQILAMCQIPIFLSNYQSFKNTMYIWSIDYHFCVAFFHLI
jgi:bacteriorhodopsin